MNGYLTNIGKAQMLDSYFEADAGPTSFAMRLFTKAMAPSLEMADSQALVEVANGNGYATGGITVTRDLNGFDGYAFWDNAGERAYVTIADLVWTASGTGIPISGDPPRWAVLVATDNSLPIAYFDLGDERRLLAGETLTLHGAIIVLSEE